MKTEITIEIQPFPVPCYVDELRAPTIPGPAPASVYHGIEPSEYQPSHRTFALRELTADDLAKLCSDFTDAVFKAAGKQQPTRAV